METPRLFYINGIEYNSCKGYSSNYISSTKYNLLSFLPLCLFNQFRRVANIYFLLIAILQSIPLISPLQPFSAIAPFVLVILVSLIREGIEDYRRYRSDKEANSMLVSKYKNGFISILSSEVQVGDILMIKKDQILPCDLILLSSSEENGLCYIETSSLDGEKNLKPRSSFSKLSALLNDKNKIRLFNLVEAEQPNNRLYQFNASIHYKGEKFSLDKSNLLLAGSVIRNTQWVIGTAVYTGEDTKLRMNLMKRSFKQSSIEKKVNKYIIIVIALQIVFCLIPAVLAVVSSTEWKTHFYLQEEQETSQYTNGLLIFFSYFLLLNTMLPISLIVSLEIVKMLQGFFMERSLTLYSNSRKEPCKVLSSSLNEELGMIKYLFTDKTGTLTCNRMKFRFCTIGKKIYGYAPGLLGPNVSYEGPNQLQDDLFGQGAGSFTPFRMVVEKFILEIKDHKQLADQFMKCLSICHECMVDKDTGRFIGPSPDEITLLETSKKIGFSFISLAEQKITLKILPFGSKSLQVSEVFEHICTLEFNSDRKRNSVIIKDMNSGFFIIYTKGADNVIAKRLSSQNLNSNTDKIMKDLLLYSQKGYRTLMLAFRIIGPKEFENWKSRYDTAINSIYNREDQIALLADEIEKELILLGCTAVEDSLQDEVPETISELLNAGIKIWMLTGDKLETAINVSKNCGLAPENAVIGKLRPKGPEKCKEKLEKFILKIRESNEEGVLVVEGEALEMIFNENMDELFFEACEFCNTVVCCRVSPGQKKMMVKLAKERYKAISLAVGDGANDVSMILEANIGVGIFGEEGMQAVQASDFAIGEFRLLWNLIIQHGRLNYIRQSEMILYFFYKNIVFTIPQLFFAFFCFYSGQTVFDDWYITLFNMMFTALPLMMKAVFDRDSKQLNCQINGTDEKNLMADAYSLGMDDLIFTSNSFALWFLKGFFHAGIVFVVPFLALGSNVLGQEGFTSDFWTCSIVSFTSVILMVSMNLCFMVRFWTVWQFVSLFFLSLLLYFAFVVLYDRLPVNAGGTIDILSRSSLSFIVIFCCLCLSVCTDNAVLIAQKVVFPDYSDRLITQDKNQKRYLKVIPVNRNTI